MLILVQPVEAVNNELMDHAVTRKAHSVTSSLGKSPSWPLLQKAATRHLFHESNDINDGNLLPRCEQGTLAYDDKVTTISYQPTEDQDTMYVSTKSSSLPNKGEKIDLTGPFCEGLSGDIDDYSDYSTNDADPEEGSLCMQMVSPRFYIPDSPQPVFVEESPLMLPDGPSQSISACVLTTASGERHVCVCVRVCVRARACVCRLTTTVTHSQLVNVMLTV